MRGALLAVVSVIGSIACMDTAELTDADQLDPNFFNLAEWVERRASELDGVPLTKTVIINGLTETRTVEDVDWSDELAPFAQSNIDRPALWDAYRVDTMLPANGRQILVYSALDSSLFTKRIEVLFSDLAPPTDSLYAITIRNSFDSYVADTEQQLIMSAGRYEVNSYQAARLLEPRTLQITAEWDEEVVDPYQN